MSFYVRKSVAEEFLKSVQENKLEYFKREIIKILEKQNDITKSFCFQLFMIEKSGLGVGHVSIYKDGSAWKKIQNNPPKWKCVRQATTYNSESAGAKQSITKLINKVRDCKNTDELLDIVLFNFNRFTDEKGQLLPIVERLKKEVTKIKIAEAVAANSTLIQRRALAEVATSSNANGLSTDETSANETISQSKDLSSKKDNSFNTIEDVKKAYQGTDKWLKAPNGKDSKLDEKQWCQVRTENFKKWFGDWENNPKSASKIVDENGEPLINYHGTSSDFNEFVKNEIGKVTNNAGIFGNGFYFTNGKKLAENYSKYNKEKKGKVIEGYLNIKKPFIWSSKSSVEVAKKLGFPSTRIKDGTLLPLVDDKQIIKFTENLKNAGYDGVIYNYKKGTGGRFEEDFVVNETVIFEPNQVKSAVNNDGKFDLSNNNINKSFSLKVKDILLGKVV